MSCVEGAAQQGDHCEDASSGTSLLSKGADGHGQAQHTADDAGAMRGEAAIVGAAGLGVFCMVDDC